jgi:long-chain acyl-CoA synthetase
MDENGFLYLVDRIRDLVLSGGYNVYPAEVERALSSHAAVAEVAVIGVPDETWGEKVVAYVVLRPGVEATADDLTEHCRDVVAGYKKPREYVFVRSLPKGSTGKILKDLLRARHASPPAG